MHLELPCGVRVLAPKAFRAAILESDGPTGALVKDLGYWAAPFDNLTHAVGCQSATDQLSCMRNVSQAALYAQPQRQEWQGPLIDGDFLTGYPSQLMQQGKCIKIPLHLGSNTNESSSFNPATPSGPNAAVINTDQDLIHAFTGWRTYNISPDTLRRILKLYPLGNVTSSLSSSTADVQEPRAADIGGDMVIIAARCKLCQLMTQPLVNQTVFSYRFDQRPWNRPANQGVVHFDNVAFSFQNISGFLGPSPAYDSRRRLSRAIGESYIRFVNLDPNPTADELFRDALLPSWPRYILESPTNMVLNASRSYVEAETFRQGRGDRFYE